MHLPMSTLEIAQFLKISVWAVEGLMKSQGLSRTIACPYRPLEALNWSSVYDALECSLSFGTLSVTLSREAAALWLCVLAELDESEDFATAMLNEQTNILAETALADGLTFDIASAIQLARIILEARLRLLEICSETDREAVW
ncbi:MAG: hypothetical protein ABJ251_09555 [Paracoccaceae bacterium]